MFVAVLALFGTFSWTYAAIEAIEKRQAGQARSGKTILDRTEDDNSPAETGFVGAATHHGGKFFQDIYMAHTKPGEIEFGHVCESPSEWEQRFEKINLEDKSHQGKVRWGDKHGGYGEHYWDFNHAGYTDDDGEESQNEPEYANYEDVTVPENHHQQHHHQATGRYQQQPVAPQYYYDYDESQQVPTYLPKRSKRQNNPNDDVEFISENVRSLVLSGLTGKHGGNYKRDPAFDRGKRQFNNEEDDDEDQPKNPGIIVDEKTGLRYRLTPVPY